VFQGKIALLSYNQQTISMNTRTILHLDLDAFYCAVEELFNPALQGKPFAVGGRPEGRGVVSSCSYTARKLGIRSAMPMSRAVQICPELVILPGRHREYGKRSREVMSILRDTAPLVEQLSIDEAFLDVTQFETEPYSLAKELQAQILEECELPSSLGIATNKLVAKIATDVGKASINTDTYPMTILQVPAGEEAEFLAPLPLEVLWGIGPKTADKLRRIGISNIGQLAQRSEQEMTKRLGKHGYDLYTRANGIDNRPVVTSREPKSFSQEVTFGQDTTDSHSLDKQLRRQSRHIAASLQKNRLVGSTVKLKLRWPNFSTITRQVTLPEPSQEQEVIYKFARELFDGNWDKKTPIRLIGVGVSGLEPPSKQLGLWDGVDYSRLAKVEAAIYEVNQKFGADKLHRGIIREDPSGDRDE
jgi:DNA polymerase-4